MNRKEVGILLIGLLLGCIVIVGSNVWVRLNKLERAHNTLVSELRILLSKKPVTAYPMPGDAEPAKGE